MSSERKQIIIDEIQYWKVNKLLPETYCDFLLALYTGGTQNDGKKKQNRLSWIPYFMLAALPLSLFIYFTEMNPSLQIALLTVFAISMIPILAWSRRHGLFRYYMGVLFVILLLISLACIGFVHIPETLGSTIVIMLHSAAWIAFSFKYNIRSFLIAGAAGILFSAASFFMWT